jgi:PST family polysaccharide transporter
MRLRDRAIKGVFWSGIDNWSSNLITSVVLLILANLLEVEDFGLVAYATVFIAFLRIFQRQGFAQAIVQRADLQPEHLNTAFWTNVVIGLATAAATYGGSDLIAEWVQKPLLSGILKGLSITLVVGSLGNTPMAILRRNLAFKSLAVRSLASNIAGGIVGITMAVHGFGVWSLVGQRLTASVAETVALWFACRWRPGIRISRKHFGDLFGFGVYMMGNETVFFFNRRSADLLIGTLLGDRALGYYTMGHRLLTIMTQLFTTTFAGVALPTFSRLQHNRAKMQEALLMATGMTSLLAFPAFLGMAVLAREMVIGLLGPEWLASIPIMQILAFWGILQALTFFNGRVIMACGKASWSFALSLANGIASVVAVVIAVRWGIVVVAAAFVIRAYLHAPFPLWMVRKLTGLSIRSYFSQFAAPLAASLAMVAVVWIFKTSLPSLLPTLWLLAGSVLIGVVVYTLTIHLLAPGRLKDALAYVRLALQLGVRY